VTSMDEIRKAAERNAYASTSMNQAAQALEQESLLLRSRSSLFRLPSPAPGGRVRAALRYRRAPEPIHFPAEATVPETKRHLELRTVLYLILRHAFGARAWIGSEQFVYWDPTDPGQRLAPDAFVRLGGPDDVFDVWKIWERGSPHLAVEIVSASDAPTKAWEDKLARYRHVGVQELVRFDPHDAREPFRIWDDVGGDLVERALDSPQAAESQVLGLWWQVVEDGVLGPMLRLSRDAQGRQLLPTPEEAERERAETERERAAALERKLRELGVDPQDLR